MPDPSSFKSNELTPEDLEVIRAFLATDNFATSSPGDEGPAVPATPPSTGQAGALDESAGKAGEADEDEMLVIFATEVDEDIADMQRALAALQRHEDIDSPGAAELPAQALSALAALRRGGHKIRGTAAAIGCNAMSTIAHAVESLVDLARSKRIELQTALAALGYALEALEATLESVVTTGQESMTHLLALDERFAGLHLPLHGLRPLDDLSGDAPDEMEVPGEAARSTLFTRREGQRLEQLLQHAGQLTSQQQEIDYARQEIDAALAELRAAQARLRRIESFVAAMQALPPLPDTPISPTSDPDAGQAVPSLEELAPSSLVARILRESTQRTGHAYRPRPSPSYAAQSLSSLEETMLWDELELDHFTEAHVLARSLNEAIADVATATSQLQQALAHLDALVKQQAAQALAIRDDAFALQSAAFPGQVSRMQQVQQLRQAGQDPTLGLLVRAGEQQVIVPFSQVQRIDYAAQPSSRQVYQLNALLGFPPASNAAAEQVTPLLVLREDSQEAHEASETPEEPVSREMSSVEAANAWQPAGTEQRTRAIQIDEALGQVELRVKPLPPALQRPGITGAAINRLGDVILALDLPTLIRRYEQRDPAGEEPHTPGEAECAPNSRPAHYSAGRAPRVLIVDDSVYIRHSLSQTLAQHGYTLLEARDGIEALEQLTTASPDVLLLDLEMPNLNGYELLTILSARALLPDLKIILLTTRSSDKHRQRAHELGIHAYLTKPCSEEELLATVAEVLQPLC